jgi:HD-like signal output (HDOD) protein
MEIHADSVTSENERIIREIGIPPCPQILIEFMDEVRSDDTDLNRISHLISKDIGLSAAVLKTANSPLYGVHHKAKSIQGALTALGLGCAANLIAGLLLRRAFADIDHAAMEEFWDSTSKIGLTAAYLARELGIADINKVHTFALFRDCGMPLLMQKFPAYSKSVMSAEAQGTPDLTDIERTQFGVHHASIGAHLAISWFLPEEMCQSIQLHHAHQEVAQKSGEPGALTAKLIALATLADCIYRAHCGVNLSERWQREEEIAFEMLGLMQEDLEPLRFDIDGIMRGN